VDTVCNCAEKIRFLQRIVLKKAAGKAPKSPISIITKQIANNKNNLWITFIHRRNAVYLKEKKSKLTRCRIKWGRGNYIWYSGKEKHPNPEKTLTNRALFHYNN